MAGRIPLRADRPQAALPNLFEEHLRAKRQAEETSGEAAAGVVEPPAKRSAALPVVDPPPPVAASATVAPGSSKGTFVEQFASLKSSKHYVPPEPAPPVEAAPADGQASSAAAAAVAPAAQRHSAHAIIVNSMQRGNKLLASIRNVAHEFADIQPDFILGQNSCALFLSLRYHALHTDYLHARIKTLGYQFRLRILLVLVDVASPEKTLNDLARICVMQGLTLILSWSLEEAGRYLETFKSYEKKPPDQLLARTSGEYLPQLTAALTTVKSVNKTDVVTLVSTFGSLYDIMQAPTHELRLCPGFGQQKVERLQAVFTTPFVAPSRIPPAKKIPPPPPSDHQRTASKAPMTVPLAAGPPVLRTVPEDADDELLDDDLMGYE